MKVLFDGNNAADDTVDETMDEGKAMDEGEVVVVAHCLGKAYVDVSGSCFLCLCISVMGLTGS